MSSVEQRIRELASSLRKSAGFSGSEKLARSRAADLIESALLREQPEARGVVDSITDYLCEQEYDIGGRDELRKHVQAALTAAQQPGQEGGRNPLLAYADSYRTMAKLGDGRVDCLSVAVDIERNMAPHAQAAPPSAPVGVEAPPEDCSATEWLDFVNGNSVENVADALTQQPAQAAPGDDEYRLLLRGDVVQAGDEVLHDNCTRWIELAGWEIGMVYDPLVFVPVRRKAPTPPGDDAAGGA